VKKAREKLVISKHGGITKAAQTAESLVGLATGAKDWAQDDQKDKLQLEINREIARSFAFTRLCTASTFLKTRMACNLNFSPSPRL
jgi:hypothetical protein